MCVVKPVTWFYFILFYSFLYWNKMNVKQYWTIIHSNNLYAERAASKGKYMILHLGTESSIILHRLKRDSTLSPDYIALKIPLDKLINAGISPGEYCERSICRDARLYMRYPSAGVGRSVCEHHKGVTLVEHEPSLIQIPARGGRRLNCSSIWF